MTRSVVGGQRVRLGPGEAASVYAGGFVEADGARVVVGSGGRCVATGASRVTVVHDGLAGTAPHRAPGLVWSGGGEVHAEAGVATVTGSGSWTATGTAEVFVGPRTSGRVEDGRQVVVHRLSEEELLARRVPLDGEAGPDFASVMEPEPTGDPVVWLAPLLEALEASGARHRGSEETGGVTTVTLKVTGDPEDVVAAADLLCPVPPSLRLVVRDGAAELVGDWGVAVRVRRSRWFGRG